MAPIGKIYTYPDNYRVQRVSLPRFHPHLLPAPQSLNYLVTCNLPPQVQAIAALNGLQVEIAPDFQMGVTNRTPEFLAKFPLGKVPGFESADGKLLLSEGQAIARYVAESGPRAEQLLGGLRGADAHAPTRALVDQWACFAEQELSANVIPLLLMAVTKMAPYDEARYERHVGALERALRALDAALRDGRRFLVGGQLTLADIMVLGPLQLATRLFVDAEMRKQAPRVEGYMKGLMEVPELKQAFGELQFCETRLKGQ